MSFFFQEQLQQRRARGAARRCELEYGNKCTGGCCSDKTRIFRTATARSLLLLLLPHTSLLFVAAAAEPRHSASLAAAAASQARRRGQGARSIRQVRARCQQQQQHARSVCARGVWLAVRQLLFAL